MGTQIAQHMPMWTFTRGVTQGSAETKADAQVIQRNKLLKSGRTVRGAYSWGHESLNICQSGSRCLDKMQPEAQAFPKVFPKIFKMAPM